MKKGGGRAKGSGFEREIAHEVIAAFKEFGIKKEDCYRTPLSGGHIFAKGKDPGDLVISPKLRKLFPFTVECKFYKKLHMHAWWIPVMKQKKAWKFRGWLEQVCKSATPKLPPMLVFKGNNLPTFCAIQCPIESPLSIRGLKPQLRFTYEGEPWIVVLFSKFLKTQVALAKGKLNADK
jgi:hypothetical protein